VAEFGPWPSRPRTEEASVLLARRPGGPWREPEATSDANGKELQDQVKASATLLPDTAPSAVVDEFWVPEAGTVDLLVVDRMVVRSRASRYHLVIDALERARRTPTGASELKAWCEQQLLQHERYVIEHLQDMPEVWDWSLGDRAEKG
jgi:XFP C-terminal domain